VTVTPTPTPSASASADPAGAAKLLREADEARARGDLDAAVAALGRLLARHPRDARVTVATFTLAQIVRSQGKHELAARHFEACGGALRGDAIAEAAASWSAAGNPERARQNAERYLDAYPSGVHADHMRQLRGGS
jgi:tetratricopeptide (TPR) repeat protein